MTFISEPLDSLRREADWNRGAVYLALLGIWLVPASLAALESYLLARMSGVEFPLAHAFAGQVPAWLVYGAFTPLVLAAAARWPVESSPRLRSLGPHLLLALGLGVPYALTAAVAWKAFSPYPARMGVPRLALAWYLSALPLLVIAYFGVVGAARALHWSMRHRRAELEAARLSGQLSEARLMALRMQLRPHFLFNSLNALAVLIRDHDVEAADRMLELLSELLRDSLRDGGEHEVTLSEELSFLRRYLELERIRYPDRLRVEWDVDTGVEDQLVPTLLLQPLVENAIRHGISRARSAGRLVIRARNERGALVIEVQDDGPGPKVPASAGDGHGVGLANTRARLATLYGADASCTLERGPCGGAVARVKLPERAASPADAAATG